LYGLFLSFLQGIRIIKLITVAKKAITNADPQLKKLSALTKSSNKKEEE